MSPRSPMASSPLFPQPEEPPPPEVVEGCFTSATIALRRLQSVLDLAPLGSLDRVPRLVRMGFLLESDRVTGRIRAEYPKARRK